jgi:ribosome biogenesis GTPase A
MERQVLPMDTHGKAKQIVSLATRKRGKDTDKKGKVYSYERNAITFFIVIPLSYLCKVELNTNNYE